ncbi:MAG: 3-hydroxybutyryl-CoA dehydrogenase [Chloroflexi bacterium]|nr:3-hydroxybutyryl-CoA dehydrogenase [Chloroflexota bacterium]
MAMKKVGVVGCGLMGSGIVEVCARAGYKVTVREVDDTQLQRGLQRVQDSLSTALGRQKITLEEMDATLERINGTTQFAPFAECDLVIEAAIEKMAVKKEIFATLDQVVPATGILASNTSSLSITEMASVTRRPKQVVGMHFFNPVPVMPLLELVQGLLTSSETMDVATQFGKSLHKTIVVAKDNPGFIVNLLLIPYILDAIRALENGVATKEDIDAAIQLGLSHPMGPFALLDFVGLDTALFVADAMYQEFRDIRYAAPPLLRRMVVAGLLGRKSGRGFYEYPRKEQSQK